MHIDAAELSEHVEAQWPGIVHVENGGDAVGDDDAGVADRPIGRGAQRDDHDVEIALRTAEVVLDGVLGLEELVKAQCLQLALQIGHREVGQQHYGVFVDVFGQECGVEVIFMQVRDIEVIAVAKGGPVKVAVIGEDKPRSEIGRVKPRIAQNAPRLCVDSKAGVADAGDLH